MLASKEQSEALKQGPDLNCRCSPAERREGCGAAVMHRLSQVGKQTFAGGGMCSFDSTKERMASRAHMEATGLQGAKWQ